MEMNDIYIKHFKVDVPDEASKIDVITKTILAFGRGVKQTIIFVNKIETCGILREALEELEYDSAILHYHISEEDREEIIETYNEEFYRVIVTTDTNIDSRIDTSLVNLVINFDLPVIHSKEETDDNPNFELYLKRSSIKGPGAVFNLLCGNKDQMIMNKIECHLNLRETKVTSFESYEDFRAAYKAADMFRSFHRGS